MMLRRYFLPLLGSCANWEFRSSSISLKTNIFFGKTRHLLVHSCILKFNCGNVLMSNTVSTTTFLVLCRTVGLSTTYMNCVLISFLIHASGNKFQWHISPRIQKNRCTEFPIGNFKTSLPYCVHNVWSTIFSLMQVKIDIRALIFSSFRKVADPRTFHWYCLHKLLHLESQSKSN